MESLPYPDEFKKPLHLSLKYLKNCNVVFFESKNTFMGKYWRFLYIIPLYVMFYLSFTMYILKLFTEGLDEFEKADMVPLWLISTQELIKFIIIMQKRKEVKAIIENLGSIWRTTDLTDEQMMMKNSALKRLNIGQRILDKTATITAWYYFLLPLGESIVRKLILAQEVELVLPVICVYPFKVDNWVKYSMVYAFQLYCVFLYVYMYLGTYILLVDLSTYISIQFVFLQEDLVNIQPTNKKQMKSDCNDETFEYYNERSESNIEDFVRRHQAVILLTQQINVIYNKIIFVNLLFSTLIICFFAIAAKASTEAAYIVTYCIAICHVMTTVFIMCYCSEMLSASSMGVAASAAKNLWYKGDSRYQNIIYVILMRAQKPCTLTTLNYSSISMKTFNRVLKTTYSYFSLASQMYDARD